MEKYIFMKEIGDGACGCVYKALNIHTNETVAIKKLKRKFYSWEECLNLREVKSLCKLNHPNIITLKEIVRENHELFFVFEFMEHNLYQIMRERENGFSEIEIRGLMLQVLQGLVYMHNNGYFHRDMKPENLLVTNDIIKIADFGLAREVLSKAPYTDYVSTRWYRAPEVLLKSSYYTPATDMWAVGAILAELFMLSPLFPGESEIDQIHKICAVLGTPEYNVWPEGLVLSYMINFNFFQFSAANLSDIIPNASLEAIDLISNLCSWDPTRRPTAEQCLQHPFFYVGAWMPCPLRGPSHNEIKQGAGPSPKLELNLWDFGAESDDCFLGLTLAVKPSISSHIDVVNNVPKHAQEKTLFCSGFQAQPGHSFMFPFASPECGTIRKPATSTPLASPYILNSQAVRPAAAAADPEPSGLSFYPLSPSCGTSHDYFFAPSAVPFL